MNFGGPFERQLGYALGAGLVWYVAFHKRSFILLIYLCSITQTTLELWGSDASMKVSLFAWYTPTSLGRISFPRRPLLPEGFRPKPADEFILWLKQVSGLYYPNLPRYNMWAFMAWFSGYSV